MLRRLRAPILRALADAEVDAQRVGEVLLVGGATRMPCVVRQAASVFGRLPHRELPPDEAVAFGAAIQAALKRGDAVVEDLVVTDVAPFSMGIATASEVHGREITGVFSPILERGTVIPASRVERFFPMRPGQRQLAVEVFQGEHPMCKDNTALGEIEIVLPKGRTREEQAVDVRFTYDLNGLLEVEMTTLATGTVQHLVIEQRPGALSRDEVAVARQEMRHLKFHPRELLPNRTALARGDALFTELTGASRMVLGEALAALRAAMELQSSETIEAARDDLCALLASLRRA